MKKITKAVLPLLAVLALGACASRGPTPGLMAPAGVIPPVVSQALMQYDTNLYFVAVDSADMPNFSMAQNTAAGRARATIAAEMSTIATQAIYEFAAANELDHTTAQQLTVITSTNIAGANLVGSRVAAFDQNEHGVWVLVVLSRESASTIINQAFAQEILQEMVGEMASFDINDWVN